MNLDRCCHNPIRLRIESLWSDFRLHRPWLDATTGPGNED